MKKKILITYKSKTWKSKKYAEMIAEELGLEAVDFDELDRSTIGDYDIVVYGAGVYAGRINGLKEAKEAFKGVKHGRFIIFATGGTPNTDTKAVNQLWLNNLKGLDLERIPHYYMQAGVCYEMMTLGMKMKLKIAASVLESQRNGEFQYSMKKSIDISSPDYAEPLIERLRSMDV